MLRLRTLGSLDVRGPAGEDRINGVGQPKRLALLAFLAVGAQGGFHRRDSLLALLWPDLDQAHARTALRKALHHLRASLGPDVVVTRHDEEVRLDPASLWCDALELTKLAAAEEHAEALKLYTGEFLPGLHVPNAPEFGLWLDAERHRLRVTAMRCALELAARCRAAEVPAEAARWARRAVEIEPLEERPNRILMELLADSGDRPAALAAYDRFSQRLAVELDLTPDAATRRIADELRGRLIHAAEENGGATAVLAVSDTVPETARPPRHTVPTRERGRPHQPRSARLGAAVLVVAASLVLGWWGVHAFGRAATEIQSLVILPFDNLTGDPEQEYFVEGIHDALIGELAQIPALRVISRTSAMQFKGSAKSVPEIARELNVDAVVAGSVLRGAGRVRVTIQLSDALEDRRLWARSYERNVREILSMQAEIAQAVAQEINGALSPAERDRSGRANPRPPARKADPAAYDAYLKGRYHVARWPEPSAEQAAIRYYDEAIAKDSGFAAAYAGLAEVLLYTVGVSTRELERAKTAANRAVQLDPALPEAYVALGMARMREWDWNEAQEAFTRAIALNPNSSVAHQWYSQLHRQMMRFDDAMSEARRAAELDPLSLPVRSFAVGAILFSEHRYDEAIRVWDDVLELDPSYGLAIYYKGLAYAMQGRGAETISAAERSGALLAGGRYELATMWLRGLGAALSGQPDHAEGILRTLETKYSSAPRVPGFIASLHLRLGREDEALTWLERGYQRRDPPLANITSEPWFDSLRSHPRFRALRAKMGLP